MNGETRGAESAESVPCTAWTPQPFPAVQEVFRTWWLKPQALYRCQEKVSGNFQEIPSVSSRPVRVCIKLQNCLVPLSPRLQVAAAGTQACLQVRPCKLALTHSGKLPQSEHGNSRRIADGRWGGGGTISKVLAMQAWGPPLDPLLLYYQSWEEEIRRFLRSAGQAVQPN